MAQYLTNITGDVFGLNFVYDRQVENIENRNFSQWREQPIYGYFMAGLISSPTDISTVSRFDFSNETVTNPDKNMSNTTHHNSAVVSASYGYNIGGVSRTNVNRLDFTNETVSQPGNNIPAQRWHASFFSAANYGYISSGFEGLLGFPQSGNGGYQSVTLRLDFSNETFSTPGKNTGAKESGGSVASGNYGYDCGGYFYRPPQNGLIDSANAQIYRFDFFTENYITPIPTGLSTVRNNISSTFSLLYGYLAGGSAPGPQGGTKCVIDRIDFSNDTLSTTTPLPFARVGGEGISNFKYGYFCGGVFISTIDRLDFTNDTISNPGSSMLETRGHFATVTGGGSSLKVNKNYGYFAGGFAPPQINTITRLDFSNDTVSNPGKNLTTSRSELASVSSNYHGYFGGGFAPPEISNITRIDFVNESINQSLGQLPSSRRLLTATESGSYGYFAGGYNAPPDNYLSTITRFDFATEIATNTPSTLPIGNRELTATSTNFYAYFVGGFNNTTYYNTVTRLDFSNETISSPGKNLITTRRNLAAITSTVYSYFGGGEEPGPTPFSVSSITRLDFNSETITTLGSNFTTARRSLAATASRTYGYFAGGFIPSYVSTVTRLDFSNEVVSEPGKTLPSARGSFTGLTNSN
jgi:hypothetical protein